jgi:hypothetical protein
MYFFTPASRNTLDTERFVRQSAGQTDPSGMKSPLLASFCRNRTSRNAAPQSCPMLNETLFCGFLHTSQLTALTP